MTNEKFTPGPWRVDERSGNIGGLSIFTEEKVCDMIADVEIHIRANGRKVAEANARLIAAAPEMYEALKFVQDHCQLYGAADAARKKIDAALARRLPMPEPMWVSHLLAKRGR